MDQRSFIVGDAFSNIRHHLEIKSEALGVCTEVIQFEGAPVDIFYMCSLMSDEKPELHGRQLWRVRRPVALVSYAKDGSVFYQKGENDPWEMIRPPGPM